MNNLKNKEDRIEFIKEFYYERLKFCGCGIPSNTLFIIRDILRVIKKRTDQYDTKDIVKCFKEYNKHIQEILNLKGEDKSRTHKINEGIKDIMYNILNNVEVLEHGSFIGCSWLTNYGEILLECLNSLSDDELENFN
ncbi:hypothetical protein [Clostridium perfringens]|jgi:hypothetical protein|uniref:Uncharacterized protein n=1 Tax=Clostridium perfringens TaxID=1502 RepID=A0AAW4IXZ1_CLOPF|nr:hypothetical protein [Clostridium perfringens]MBO3356197.1 hypothetical protein [Clostridium perfringens]MBO3359462.1 hypothetical protein [Clostridium perfringens]